jgi:single-strand DNA-binding protein
MPKTLMVSHPLLGFYTFRNGCIIIIGNLGRDPEVRYTPTGQMVASFSIASNHRYKTASGEQREETEWFNWQAFGKLAETCNAYLSKGQQVYVEGRLTSRTYQTRDGQTRHSNDITVREIHFLSGKGADASVPPIDSRTGAPEQRGMDDAEDLPF